MELRYPVSLNPSSTIYVLCFMEAGNSWNEMNKFNPFDVKRSAGMGIRIFMPMFGILGVEMCYIVCLHNYVQWRTCFKIAFLDNQFILNLFDFF